MPPHDDEPELLDPPPRPLPPYGWRERLAGLAGLAAGRPLAAAAVVAGVVVGVAVLLPLAQRLAAAPRSTPVEASLPVAAAPTSTPVPVPSGGAAATAAGSPGQGGELLVVHAAGSVRTPGVYELPAGSRVDDLVAAAGGLADDADGDRVNLALPLVDGERVYVPAQGEVEVPQAPAPGGSGGGSGGEPGGGRSGPVDLNSATFEQLDALPGVGPVTAQAILDHRERQGPFGSVDELLDVQGIGDARLAQLRDLVVV